jgi:hypothetical protein
MIDNILNHTPGIMLEAQEALARATAFTREETALSTLIEAQKEKSRKSAEAVQQMRDCSPSDQPAFAKAMDKVIVALSDEHEAASAATAQTSAEIEALHTRLTKLAREWDEKNA